METFDVAGYDENEIDSFIVLATKLRGDLISLFMFCIFNTIANGVTCSKLMFQTHLLFARICSNHLENIFHILIECPHYRNINT